MLIKRQKVQELTSLSRSSLYRLIAQKLFPAPVKIGSKSSAWILAEVFAWIEERKASRDSKAGV